MNERQWAGGFGDAYTDRNAAVGDIRGDFWQTVLDGRGVASVLEVGCNVGANLRWVAQHVPAAAVVGVDVNEGALERMRQEQPRIGAVCASAVRLPFRDRWFDLVFTMAVLQHIDEAALPIAMSEVVRCSGRFVLCAEYAADEPTDVNYRGVPGLLVKRDFGGMYLDLFPELQQIDGGFLDRAAGFDDVTWWLFQRHGV